MATDVFLKIDGIDGESTDTAHKNWIEILSFSHDMTQPTSRCSSTGGRTTERVNMGDFEVIKVLDKASPTLALAVCDGRHIQTVRVELCEASGAKHMFMAYDLENVILSRLQPSSDSGGDKPLERLMFNFGKIKWTYQPLTNEGKPGSKVGPIGWSMEENKKI